MSSSLFQSTPVENASGKQIFTNKPTGFKKPWLFNLIVIFGFLIVTLLLPELLSKLTAILVWSISSFWAYYDAKKLQIQNYKKVGFVIAGSPNGVAGAVWFLWVIAFPMYISYRQKIIDGKIPLKDAK